MDGSTNSGGASAMPNGEEEEEGGEGEQKQQQQHQQNRVCAYHRIARNADGAEEQYVNNVRVHGRVRSDGGRGYQRQSKGVAEEEEELLSAVVAVA